METTTHHITAALRDKRIAQIMKREGFDYLGAYRRDQARQAVNATLRAAPRCASINMCK
jgi:hypothetical protein